MARLKPKSGAAVGSLTHAETWFLFHGDLATVGYDENPFGPGPEGWAAAEKAWRAHRAALIENAFPGERPLWGEVNFDGARAPWESQEQFMERTRLEETQSAR